MKAISWKNTVTVRVNNFEAFANECIKDGISLSDIRAIGDGYECDMDFSEFRRVRNAVSRSGVRIRIVKKRGAGYFMRLHRKRYGFYLGAFLALCAFIYLTSCIWVVDVVGNDITPRNKILSVMDKNGIGIGKFRFGKKISRIKNNALIELDSLSWLWVTLDGTRALVEVREKGTHEEIIDKSVPCNLVASYPAEIVDMQVKSGRKVVERGKIVGKGELLVSGITETVYRSNRYIHSMGTVTGRTWRTMDGKYSYVDEKSLLTGREEHRYTLKFPGGKVSFGTKTSNFKEYKKRIKHTPLKIFKNIYLPLTFTTETFCEIIKEYETLPEEEVLSRALNYLTEKLESQRPREAHTVKRTYGYETQSDGNMYVTVTLESLENIAVPVKIDVSTTEEDNSGQNN